MDVEITEKRDNPLLSRKEVRFGIRYEGATPKFAEVRTALIEKLKSDDKLTVVDAITPQYGRHKATGYVKVYESAEAMKVENAQKIKKNLEGKKKKKPGEAEAAEAPAAKPAEVKKKEAK